MPKRVDGKIPTDEEIIQGELTEYYVELQYLLIKLETGQDISSNEIYEVIKPIQEKISDYSPDYKQQSLNKNIQFKIAILLNTLLLYAEAVIKIDLFKNKEKIEIEPSLPPYLEDVSIKDYIKKYLDSQYLTPGLKEQLQKKIDA